MARQISSTKTDARYLKPNGACKFHNVASMIRSLLIIYNITGATVCIVGKSVMKNRLIMFYLLLILLLNYSVFR